MRNLKRALSLALASVMLVGMMVVGTSAASFSDVDETKHDIEAIEVLHAVGVMNGDAGTDKLRPDDKVSRNEMAVIMARLILGNYEADSYTGVHPFTDVPSWADKYVAACYASGIINGTSATTYSGTNNVTAVQAAAMMLRALGYEDLSKTKPGQKWDVPVAAKANEINLFEGMNGSGTAQLTRNEIASLALNTLKANVVTTTKGDDISIPGTIEIVGSRNYNPVPRPNEDGAGSNYYLPNGTTASTGDAGCDYQQLCEKLYGNDLKLINGDDDDFGRPGDSKWMYKNDKVYNVVKDAVATFTGDTSEDNVYKALRSYKIKQDSSTATHDINKTKPGSGWTADITNSVVNNTDDTHVEADFNGVTTKSPAKVIADMTKNGLKIEFFANDDKVITDVVFTEYTVGEVTKVTTNKDGDVSYSISNGGGTKKTFADSDKDDEIVIAGTIEEDDIVTFTKDMADSDAPMYVYPTTNFNGTQSAFNNSKSTITVDGKTYDVGTGLDNVIVDGTEGNFPNSSDEATFYVDQFGFVVKSDAVEADTNWAVVDEIIYVKGSGLSGSKYVEASLVFADGTTKTAKVTKINGIKVDNAKFHEETTDAVNGYIKTLGDKSVDEIHINSVKVSNNANLCGKIVKYSEKNDEYELTYVDLDANVSGAAAGNVNNGKTGSISGANATVTVKGVPSFAVTGGSPATASGNDNTVYIVKKGDDEFSSYTGYKNVPDITNLSGGSDVSVVYVTDSKNAVEMVYIVAGSDNTVGGDSGDIFYVTNRKYTTEKVGDDTIYVLEGILNGEAGELRTDSTFEIDGVGSKNFSNLTEDALYEVEVDGDGYVTEMTTQGTSGPKYFQENMTEAKEEKKGVVAGKAYDSDTKVYVIDGDDVSEGDVTDARAGDLIYIKVKGTAGGTDADDQTIEVMYVIKESAVLYNVTATAPGTVASWALNDAAQEGTTIKAAAGDKVTITYSDGTDNKFYRFKSGYTAASVDKRESNVVEFTMPAAAVTLEEVKEITYKTSKTDTGTKYYVKNDGEIASAITSVADNVWDGSAKVEKTAFTGETTNNIGDNDKVFTAMAAVTVSGAQTGDSVTGGDSGAITGSGYAVIGETVTVAHGTTSTSVALSGASWANSAPAQGASDTFTMPNAAVTVTFS